MDHIGGYDATLLSHGWPSFELGVGPSKLDGWMCSATFACCMHSITIQYARKENKKVTSPLQCMVDLPEMNATTTTTAGGAGSIIMLLVYTHTSSCSCASFCSVN
jgi:hypothetical protein